MEFVLITFVFNFFINVIPLTYNILKNDELLIFKTMLHCLGAVIILGAPLDMGITTEEFYITEFAVVFSFIIPFMTAIYQKKNVVVFADKEKVILKGIVAVAMALLTGALILFLLL